MIGRAGITVLICATAITAGGAAFSAAPNGTIGVALPNVKGEWYTPELYGLTDEAKKLGYDLIIQDAGGYANVDKAVTQVSNLLVQKVKALVLDAADPAAFNGVVRQVKDAQSQSSPLELQPSQPITSLTPLQPQATVQLGMSLPSALRSFCLTAAVSQFLRAPREPSGLPNGFGVSSRISAEHRSRLLQSKQVSKTWPLRSRSPATSCNGSRMSI